MTASGQGGEYDHDSLDVPTKTTHKSLGPPR
jgi:hypothetical protein